MMITLFAFSALRALTPGRLGSGDVKLSLLVGLIPGPVQLDHHLDQHPVGLATRGVRQDRPPPITQVPA
jgi:hypothetical protein